MRNLSPRPPKMFPAIQEVVLGIPRGRVATYGQVARAAGYPGAARQVVWALRAAPRGLPWHRVLGAGGRILLSGAEGVEQTLRLRHEGVSVRQGRVLLADYLASLGQLRQRTVRRAPAKRSRFRSAGQ